MPVELPGYLQGQRLAEQDQQSKTVFDLGVQDQKLKLESAQMTLDSQKKMLDLMNGIGSGMAPGGQPGQVPPADALASSMDTMASFALKSGMPEKAREYANTASTMRTNSQAIETKQLEDTIKTTKLAAQLMEGVTDQAGWSRANAMFSMLTGKRSVMANIPYSKEVHDNLMNAITSKKDEALTQAALARQRASDASVKASDARVDLIKAQTDLAEKRSAALGKAGGAKGPKAATLKAITDLAIENYSTLPPEEARVLSRPVAERVEEIMSKQNLSLSEASTQAFAEAEQQQVFGGQRERRDRPGTADKPLDLATDQDTTKLKLNMYYKNAKGQVALWNGKGFVPVAAKK